MINKDLHYLIIFATTIVVLLISDNRIKININVYLDFVFYIILLLLSNVDLLYAVLLSLIYLVLKIKNVKSDRKSNI
jgi:hypothetical protein